MSQTESLLKRLAGPSSGKAGLQKDQTDINAIIAEASKGSKFYENEKRKDRELTERIGRIRAQLDGVRAAADIPKIEHGADKLLADLDAQRDLSQIIVHVDMDAFFASVEILHNPSLKGKAFGVGTKSGVLTTASYEARKFGVRSGMAGFVAAKLHPELIFVPNVHSRYYEMSNRVMDVFQRYDPNMAVAGCDEGYLNITSYCEEHGIGPDELVEQIRKQVHKETSLTVSAGIAPNKMLAKICSDKNKPNGQFHLPFDRSSIMDFIRNLPIRKVPGVGRVSERVLESVGVHTCGDVFVHRATLSLLSSMKVVSLPWLLSVHLGLGSTTVAPGTRDTRRSIGAERTFSTITDREGIMRKLSEVVDELASDMEGNGWAGRTVTLKYKLDTFQVFTRAKTFDRLVRARDDLLAIGTELILAEGPLRLRLLGLRVTKLKDLHAPENSNGIQRFFQAGPAADTDSSAKKKRRHGETIYVEDDELPSPRPSKIRLPPALDGEEPRANFFAASPEPSPEPGPRPHSRLTETPANFVPSLNEVEEGLEEETPVAEVNCPICGSLLSETSDRAVNEHIDFCLSKSAIRSATRSNNIRPSLSPRKRSSDGDSGSKPISRTGKRTIERNKAETPKGGLDGFFVRSTSPSKQVKK